MSPDSSTTSRPRSLEPSLGVLKYVCVRGVMDVVFLFVL